ncbi:hypothetical protein CEQ90_01975 [Lewinellaceae bacterium SD302]|nr:hypothetical protein CEQ90_01975 [Lewinellaceae bacterium SD302]
MKTKSNEVDSTYRLVGVSLMLLGAILFATKAIFIKLAYRHEVSSISLLALRMAFSLPFFIIIGYWQSRKNQEQEALSGRDLLTICLVGATGYYLASYFDFLGLQYLSAGMERLILFMYPTLVLLLGWIFLKKKIKSIQWFATLITYLGMALAFSSADLSINSGFLLGTMLIFGSALTFAIYVLMSGELAPRIGSIRFTSLAMIAAATAVLSHAAIQGAVILGLSPIVYGYGFAIAIVATVIPSYLLTEGIKRIGAGNAAILGAIGPVATIILEYLVLEETLNLQQWAGAILIITGVVVIGRNK